MGESKKREGSSVGAIPEVEVALKDRALAVSAEGITIADARLPDMPLLYANAGFERLTGYSVADVLGRNCRFLQGPDTDPEAAEEIRRGIREETGCVVEILNYRKDGSTFWNRLSITPVRDADGEVTHYVGIQSDVTARRNAEDELRSASTALERANQLMRRDIEAAARIQRSLLPSRLPELPNLRFAWTFLPCTDLAGDTLNVIPFNDRQVALYVLDVSGHGIPAALLSVTLSHTLSPVPGESCLFAGSREHGDHDNVASPAQVADRLNRQFQMEPGRVQYFTMFYGVLDVDTHELRYVSAGHPPAIRVAEDGTAVQLEAEGFPIGMIEEADFETRSVELSPGDRLYVYTDGVVEAHRDHDRELGIDRLQQTLVGARCDDLEASVAAAQALVERWTAGAEPEDDITVLALEIDRA